MQSHRLAVTVSTLAVVMGLSAAIWPQEAGAKVATVTVSPTVQTPDRKPSGSIDADDAAFWINQASSRTGRPTSSTSTRWTAAPTRR